MDKNEQEKKRGRPSKNYVDCHLQLPQEAKEEIEKLSEVFDVSQGEMVAIAIRQWKRQLVSLKSE